MTDPREAPGGRGDVPGREDGGRGSLPASGPRSAPEVFGEALEVQPEARASFLDRACAGDAELRAEVESLLAAHAAGAPAFFGRPLQVTSSGKVLSGGLDATALQRPRRFFSAFLLSGEVTRAPGASLCDISARCAAVTLRGTAGSSENRVNLTFWAAQI